MTERAIVSFMILGFVCSAALIPGISRAQSQSSSYPWVRSYDPTQAIDSRIAVPEGFERLTLSSGCFSEWLRHLPLKPGRPEVFLYNGQKKADQTAHLAVVDIDVGNRDLQQCADAIIRLRAEYLYSRQRPDRIHFRFTSGDVIDYPRWADGYRPSVLGSVVTWSKKEPVDWSYDNFRKYLDVVFQYAGSSSLSQDMTSIKDVTTMRVGDAFVKGGFPGHAVLVVDMAWDPKTDRRVFLLAQSFMPAQDIHILKNPRDSKLNPWYDADFGPILYTPEWIFGTTDLKRFPEE